jgi:hypothetical protein
MAVIGRMRSRHRSGTLLPNAGDVVSGTQMSKFVRAAAIVLVLAACGACGIGSGSGPTPTPSSSLRFDVTATENDHAVTMRTGQRLEVVLHAGRGLNSWTHPESSDSSVLAPIVDPAATSARDVTLAAFEARKVGQAEVTATASPMCTPGQACPMYIALYSLKVTVTP